MKRLAFTLIELLVAIAVIALLAAIVLPVLARARDAGRRAGCLSNLRQIGEAVQMYSQDADEAFPFGGDACDLTSGSWAFTPYADAAATMDPITDILNPYTKSRRVWKCPSDTGSTACGHFEGRSGGLTAYQNYGSSYLYNTMLTLYPSSLPTAKATDDAKHDYGPSEILLFFDITGKWHGGGLLGSERTNAVYVDGHAKNLNASTQQQEFARTIVN